MKTRYTISALLLVPLACLLLMNRDTTAYQFVLSRREAGVLLIGWLYGYGAGAFLWARKDQLLNSNDLFAS